MESTHCVVFDTKCHFRHAETDQPVRLGPDRGFPTIKAGVTRLSGIAKKVRLASLFTAPSLAAHPVISSSEESHIGQTVSLRPKRLTRPPSVDGADLSHHHFPTIGGKAGFRPELLGDQIPLIRGIYGATATANPSNPRGLNVSPSHFYM